MAFIEKYKLAFDITPVPMMLAGSDGKIVLANSKFHELFEYEPEELIGLNVEDLVPEPIRDHHPDLRGAYHRVPTKRSMGAGRDLYGVTKFDKIIPLELGLEPVSEGRETMALVAALDIRQRKANEERMHQAMDAAASAMVMVNDRGVIVFVNLAASKLFGYDERDLLGKPVELLVPEEARRAHPVYIGSFMSDSSARSMGLGRDLFARRKDGTPIPVEIALTRVDSSDEKLVMSTIIDLSERVAAAEEVAQKAEELEALNIELSHFAYSASHDLKAPLSTITGLLSLCLEDLDANNVDEVRANIAKVAEISRRSASKVEGILSIARAGRDAVENVAVPLESTIEEIWLDLSGGNTDTQLMLELKHTEPVITELQTFMVIMENLLSNALTYRDQAKPEHIVRINSETEEGRVRITVSDNGVGIGEDDKKKVFRMFHRMEERSGDGLGLALVQKQIDRLGGSITVAGVAGHGANFSFTLPLEGQECEQNSSCRRR
ncbi:MAG: PAS domain S-box protein [Paracoccaceae bacterium]